MRQDHSQESTTAVTPREQKAEGQGVVDVITTRDLVARIREARGKVVVVNFWATWCPPCVEEMPAFVDFYNAIQGSSLGQAVKEVEFVSISADHPDTVASRVEPFVKEHKLPFPVHVIDTRSPDEVSAALGLNWDGGLPATFLFDRDGKVKQEWSEEVTDGELVQAVKTLQ